MIEMYKDSSNQKHQNLPNIIKLMLQRREKTCFLLKWNQNDQKWKKWSISSSPKPFYHCLKQFTTMTLNVLFDLEKRSNKKKEQVIHSRDRYSFIIQQSGNLLPDVITYNEATPLFQAMLREAQWVRKEYWISELLVGQTGFGNMILTKKEPIFFDKIRTSSLPRLIEMIFLPIQIQGRIQIMAIGSVHLTALSTNTERRTKQFKGLLKYLQRYQQFVKQFVLQGDMNFHSQQECSIFQPKFVDAWKQIYDLKTNPGYTFNSSQNTLINEIYWGFQRRDMRLDRILHTANRIKCKQIRIQFNSPIYAAKNQEKTNHHIFLKGGLMWASEKLGLSLFRQQKQNYLYPSDHFGLISTFLFKEK